jgi:hypothetical protein
MVRRYYNTGKNNNTMKNNLLICLIFIMVLFSCEKSTYLVNSDPNYPTIIKIVNAERLSSLRSDFALQNVYVESSINAFGFCDYTEDPVIAPDPPVDTNVTRSDLISIAKGFLLKNSFYTGVKETDNPEIIKVIERNNFQDGNKHWYVEIKAQKIDSIDVLSTLLYVTIRGREVISCQGNWFPEIYVPKEFNVNEDLAKRFLIDRTVTHIGMAGNPIDLKITSAALQKGTVSLVAVPIENEDQIEIHVAWKIWVDQVSFILYVDVMTGEVIRQEPTVIS